MPRLPQPLLEQVEDQAERAKEEGAEMRIAIYRRVSGDKQEKEGTSLQTQQDGCLKYCRDKGYDVAYDFSETYSGLTLERPKLNELRELVRAREIDVLVVYCLDRLSRDPTHGVILIQEIEKHNVSLEAVTETVDCSELGKLISYIRGFAAKLEAEKIRERTMRGKRKRAEAGRLPSGTGRKLYGYDYITGKGIGEGVRYIKESETKWVRQMYTWLVEEGLTVNGITRRLRALGVPTPSGGQFWIRQTVYRMLTNPAYIGRTYAFTRDYVEPRRRRNPNTKRKKTGIVLKPRDQWIELPNATPAIIDEDVFEAAQTILKRNKQLASRNAKRPYLLSGYVFCARCGRRYQGYVKKWKDGDKRHEQRYYRCGASQTIVNPSPCDNRELNGPALEAAVWTQIEAILSQPDVVLGEIERRRQEAGDTSAIERSLATIEAKMKHRGKEWDRIHRAFYVTGDEERFISDVAEFKEQGKALENQKEELERSLMSSRELTIDMKAIEGVCGALAKNLGSLGIEQKRLALEALQARVNVDGSHITLDGAVPIPDRPIEPMSIRSPKPHWPRWPL